MKIKEWIDRVINGPSGMNSFEQHELVVWHCGEREAAANWIIRCLANPQCEGTEDVLHAIMEQRAKAQAAS